MINEKAARDIFSWLTKQGAFTKTAAPGDNIQNREEAIKNWLRQQYEAAAAGADHLVDSAKGGIGDAADQAQAYGQAALTKARELGQEGLTGAQGYGQEGLANAKDQASALQELIARHLSPEQEEVAQYAAGTGGGAALGALVGGKNHRALGAGLGAGGGAALTAALRDPEKVRQLLGMI